jgi:hypothetical protein
VPAKPPKMPEKCFQGKKKVLHLQRSLKTIAGISGKMPAKIFTGTLKSAGIWNCWHFSNMPVNIFAGIFQQCHKLLLEAQLSDANDLICRHVQKCQKYEFKAFVTVPAN